MSTPEIELPKEYHAPFAYKFDFQAHKLYLNWILNSFSVSPILVLAQSNYFDDPAFLNYLKYLEYWRGPEYAQFLTYPSCLKILEMLKEKRFRTDIKRRDVAQRLADGMMKQWLGDRSFTMEGPPETALDSNQGLIQADDPMK